MKQRQKGFTLVEVLVALVVMAIGLTGVAMMNSSTIVADTGGRQQVTAVTLAQGKLEQLHALNRADTAWDAGIHAEYVADDGTVGSGLYTREWEVEEDYNGHAHLMRVTVTVSWDGGAVSLASLYW